MSYPLALRVPAQAGEPADSLLHRLAARWGLSRPEFQKLIRLDERERKRGAHTQWLATLAGLDEYQLLAATPRRLTTRRRVIIGEAWTDVADVAPSGARFCPGCLREDSFASDAADLKIWSRPEWSVRSIATCVRHRALLMGACGHCGEVPGVSNPSIGRCACGRCLADTPTPTFVSRVDEVLGGAIQGVTTTFHTSSSGLHQISAFLRRLGGLTLGWAERRPMEEGEALTLREAGLELAEGGEGALFSALDGILRDGPLGRCGKPGLTSSYGWVWRSWLGVPPSSGLDAAARSSLLKHATASGIQVSQPGRGVTLTASRAILGAGHDRTRRLLEGVGLLCGNELRGRPMSVDESRVKALSDRLTGLLTAGQAARVLGVGKTQFRALRACEIIRPSISLPVGSRELFSSSDLTDLLSRLKGTMQFSALPDGWLSLPQACQRCSVPLSRAVTARLQGRIPGAGEIERSGLAGALIRIDDARSLKRKAVDTIKAAADALGLHYEAAAWLTRHGHLGSEGKKVDARRIAQFGRCYATTAHLADGLGCTTKIAYRKLIGAGLKPAFGPPECRQAIWKRSEVRLALACDC